jgi:hypothetical protein
MTLVLRRGRVAGRAALRAVVARRLRVLVRTGLLLGRTPVVLAVLRQRRERLRWAMRRAAGQAVGLAAAQVARRAVGQAVYRAAALVVPGAAVQAARREVARVVQEAREVAVRPVARVMPAAARHRVLGLRRWRPRAVEFLRRGPVVREARLLRAVALAVSARLEVQARA